MTTATTRIMSGMRPTGRLHLGHYVGVLKNWLALQADYDCYFMVADWHALTTRYADTTDIAQNRLEMVKDWLAVGINPDKATIYVQSDVPQIAELSLLLSMLVPLPWVKGDPTLKDMVKDPDADLHMGLLSYPILQTADILMVLGEKVPVGKDQLAHLEISRDIARRFNHTYQTDLLPEPQPLLTEVPLLMGVDGNKMGKSANNGIYLSDTEEDTIAKLKGAVTDRNRIKRTDPGNPDACEVVFPYYELFADQTNITLADSECRSAARGCMDCKKILAEQINEQLRPIRQRREEITDADAAAVLAQGAKKVSTVAADTLSQVRQAMKIA